MFTFFKFLLLLFLGFLLFLFILGWSLFMNIRRIFRPFNGQQQSQYDSSYSRRHTSSSGTVIIDERTEKNAGRRIIPDDEGEYVDYEETK